ncbi:hypothetical protein, partial [Vulcanococcus limneticus]|uniref:hypothetical protein n=1 Tax=Vulcanococcus limneticus TaxID=2170428 RepID=UPI00398C181E
IGDRLEEPDQIEIACSSCGFEHGRRMTAAIEPDDYSQARAPVTYFESALSAGVENHQGVEWSLAILAQRSSP